MWIRLISFIFIFILGLTSGYLGSNFISIPYLNNLIGKLSPYLSNRADTLHNAHNMAKDKANKMPSKGEKGERKPLFYRNPMNPAITSPVPAKDEMGMDYIPVYPEDLEGSKSAPHGTVVIDPVTMQKMGIRTMRAGLRRLSREITTYGEVTYNEDEIYMVHAKFKGWAERLIKKRTGERVKKGDVLAWIYSPELITAQSEYVMAIKGLRAVRDGNPLILQDAKRLLSSSQKRLKRFGMPQWFISGIKRDMRPKRLVPLISPSDGIIISINIRENAFISPQKTLYNIADLKTVWVIASFYEEELPWIKEGDAAIVEIDSIKDRVFQGEIDLIYPTVDKKTRTVKGRIRLKDVDNKALSLLPGMYARVSIKSALKKEVIAIPKEALLITGKREHVFVMVDEGKFEPRTVEIGMEADGLIEVKKGISEGEEVVISGQFLIDSESSLKEAAIKMMDANIKGLQHGNNGMKMDMKGMKMEKKMEKMNKMNKMRKTGSVGDKQMNNMDMDVNRKGQHGAL